MAGSKSLEPRKILQENLLRAIAALGGFVIASAVTLIADIPLGTKIGAAMLVLVSLFLVVVWLPRPWSEWTERRGRRLLLATAPLAGAGLLLFVGFAIRPVRVDYRLPATLLLLDASETMEATLSGDITKLLAASTELRKWATDIGNTQLGLATFGVDTCGTGPPIDVLVPIAGNRADRIVEHSERISTRGTANLVSAGKRAIGLLGRFEKPENRRLLIITGGLDGCGRDLHELLRESELRVVAIQWELVGLGFTDQEKAEANALPNVEVYFADSSDELSDVFRQLLFRRPLRREFDRVYKYVAIETRGAVNKAVLAIDARDVAAMRESVEKLTRLLDEGEKWFDQFSTKNEASVFAPVKELLQEQWGYFAATIPALQRLADFDEAHPEPSAEERNRIVNDEWNPPIKAYNDNLPELLKLIEEALNKLFARK